MAKALNTNSFSREDLALLFNIEADSIEDIGVFHTSKAINVSIRLKRKLHNCPACNFETDRIKGYTNKKILHSILTNNPCFIHYKARRHICPNCNKTFYEHNPFSHENMKISVVTVSNVLEDLKQVGETFSSVSKRYQISASTASSIFDAHVIMSRKMLPEYLCIDECYAFSGLHGDYVCVLVDYLSQHTIDLLPSRKKPYLLKYFESIPLYERKKVKLACIDMWETYRVIVKRMLPNCKVAVDKFHVIADLARKLDMIRIKVMKDNYSKVNLEELKRVASHNNPIAKKKLATHYLKDKNYYLLKKFNWLLKLNFQQRQEKLDINIKKRYNKKFHRYLNYSDLLNLILDIDQDLKEAYYIYLDFDLFYRSANTTNAKERLEQLIERTAYSNMKEMVDFSNTLKRWKYEIINSFTVVDTYENKNGYTIERKINNGIIENKNRTLKLLKNNSSGYKNWERFRNRALYVLNDDATYYLNPNNSK